MSDNLLEFLDTALRSRKERARWKKRIESPFILKEYCDNGGKCCKLTKSVIDEHRASGQLSTIVDVWRAELAPLSQLHAAINTVASSLHFWAKQHSLEQRLVFDAIVDTLDVLKLVDWSLNAEAMSKNVVFLSWQSSAQTDYAERAEIGALELVVREKRSMNALFAKSYCVDLYCYFFVGDGAPARKHILSPFLPRLSPPLPRVSRSLPGSPRHARLNKEL